MSKKRELHKWVDVRCTEVKVIEPKKPKKKRKKSVKKKMNKVDADFKAQGFTDEEIEMSRKFANIVVGCSGILLFLALFVTFTSPELNAGDVCIAVGGIVTLGLCIAGFAWNTYLWCEIIRKVFQKG